MAVSGATNRTSRTTKVGRTRRRRRRPSRSATASHARSQGRASTMDPATRLIAVTVSPPSVTRAASRLPDPRPGAPGLGSGRREAARVTLGGDTVTAISRVAGSIVDARPWLRAWEAVAERDGLRRLLLVLPTLVVLLVLFVAPLTAILRLSLLDPAPTARYYLEVVTNPTYLHVLGITFETAALVTLLCLALGYPLAYVMATVPGRLAGVLIILVIVPFWISVLVRTYAWMVMLGRGGLVNTLL